MMLSITSQAAPTPSLDLELARERLTTLLAFKRVEDHVYDSGMFPILQHPLVSTVYAPSMREHYIKMIEQNARAVMEYLDEGTPENAMHLFAKPYLLDGLLAIESAMNDTTFWETASHAWQIMEWPSQEYKKWKEVFLSGRPCRDAMMNESDRAKLEAMPDQFTIWRGTNSKEKIPGMSWTLDQDRAHWFAKRNAMFHGGKAKVLQHTVAKTDVIAYIEDRNESEIITIAAKP